MAGRRRKRLTSMGVSQRGRKAWRKPKTRQGFRSAAIEDKTPYCRSEEGAGGGKLRGLGGGKRRMGKKGFGSGRGERRKRLRSRNLVRKE